MLSFIYIKFHVGVTSRVRPTGSILNLLSRRQLTSRSEDGSPSFINKYTERTHNCGQINKDDIGKSVTLYGWVQYTRFDNKIISLRDSYGTIQCVVDKNLLTKQFRRRSIHNESMVKISGTVQARPEDQSKQDISGGAIEVVADEVTILGMAKSDLTILSRENNDTTLVNNLKYRYLYLRRAEMQHALRFRSKVNQILRNKLYNLNFVECETPTLFNRTPGGANEFIVPTQQPGKFYSLVQSPQQLKQLLMIGGIDRYFQICRCYRDESGRSDRQPEFTQLDIELSYTNQGLVMSLIEDLLHDLLINVAEDQETVKALTASFDNDGKFMKIPYKESFEKYGTDKPDLRFGWTIENNDDGGLHLTVPHSTDGIDVGQVIESSRKSLQYEHAISSINSREGLRLVATNKSDESRKILGLIRTSMARLLDQSGTKIYDQIFKFVWVTDFPLFTVDESGKLEPNHHPFTAPSEESIHLLDEEPSKVLGQHYDLVLNGQEVAGGSMRIHDAELQRRIFVDILRIEDDTFNYFLDALKSGCPPHGGIAFGLDRLIAILMNRESIRDVIAFPKSHSGRDLMTECPQEIADSVRRLYHIK